MRLSDQDEKRIIMSIITKEIKDKIPGMFFGQLKRFSNQGYSNHEIRVGLELMVAKEKLNKRTGLAHVTQYVDEAIRLEGIVNDDFGKTKISKTMKIPFKKNLQYRNNKLKELE